jgi:hypothetical protein
VINFRFYSFPFRKPLFDNRSEFYIRLARISFFPILIPFRLLLVRFAVQTKLRETSCLDRNTNCITLSTNGSRYFVQSSLQRFPETKLTTPLVGRSFSPFILLSLFDVIAQHLTSLCTTTTCCRLLISPPLFIFSYYELY